MKIQEQIKQCTEKLEKVASLATKTATNTEKYYWEVKQLKEAVVEMSATFKDLTEAYAVLSDEEKRKQYDSYGYRSMNKYTQDELIKSVNMDNIFKGVKFVADLERNYGLVSGLIGIGLTGRTTSKTLRLAGKLLKGKSMLDTVTGNKHRNRHRNKSINKD